MMLMISDPISTSSGFDSITSIPTWSKQSVGADERGTGADDGSKLIQIGLQGISK